MAKKKSSKYWKDRFLLLEESSNRIGMDTYRQIEPAFDKAQREIQNQINIWYSRVAKNNQITIEEAKKLLSAKELKEFRWDVEEYIKYGRENAMNQQWIKELENASAKVHISRLEALKIRTQQAAEVAFGNELDQLDDMARRVYTEDYYRTIYEMQKGFNIGWEIGEVDQRKLDKLISKPWTADNKTFKDRIWTTKNQMISELHQQLTRTCLLGKAPDEAIEAMTKYVDKDIKNKKYAAGRLVMTEQAYFHSASQKDAFAELDVEKVEIVATLDSHTSTICQDMDGQIVEMKDYEPGVTVPPFHVFCRSVTVPYFEDNYTGERAARDEDGNTYYVPDDMTYKDWKKSFVGSSKMSIPKNSSIEFGNGNVISTEQYKALREYADDKGIVLRGFKDSDVDIELTKEFIDESALMIEKYPILKGDSKRPFTLELSRHLSDEDFAQTRPGVTHIIELNANYMRDKSLLSREYKLKADEGWFVKGTDYKSVIVHEIGHLIGDKKDIDGLEIAKSILNTTSADIVFKHLEDNLSIYSSAVMDGSEIISEALSAYESGNSNDFVLTFLKMCGII